MITILKTLWHNGKVPVMAKTFKMCSVDSYDDAFEFEASQRDVANIRELSSVLSEIESNRHLVVIRGRLKAGVDPSRVRRKSKETEDGPAHFEEVPGGIMWGMFDFDKIPAPDWLPADMDMRREYLISLLPECFHNVAYHWQWSSSAGVYGWDKLSGHAWFWFDHPHTDQELYHWAKQHPVIDKRCFLTVQPLYTARPIFIRREDPLGSNRSYFVHKELEAVPLPTFDFTPFTVIEVTEEDRKRLDSIKERKQEGMEFTGIADCPYISKGYADKYRSLNKDWYTAIYNFGRSILKKAAWYYVRGKGDIDEFTLAALMIEIDQNDSGGPWYNQNDIIKWARKLLREDWGGYVLEAESEFKTSNKEANRRFNISKAKKGR